MRRGKIFPQMLFTSWQIFTGNWGRWVYVLNPAYRLRHDVHRSVLFAVSLPEGECSRGWVGFIHPLQAALLSFFTWGRPLGETLGRLAGFFHRPEEQLWEWVCGLVENRQPVRTCSPQGEICFPKRVLVEAGSGGGAVRLDCLEAGDFIWRKLDLTGRRLYTGPLQVTLMLTNRCVTHCRYCYADTATRVTQPLDTERLCELVDEAARLPVKQCNLMGGEIFLHPDWLIVLKKLVEKGIAPEYVSTKIPLTEELVKVLVESGYRGTVQVSLDAWDEEVLHRLLGVGPGYAERVWQGLQRLDGSGLRYQVATVLTTLNGHIGTLKALYDRLLTLRHLQDWRLVPVSLSLYREYGRFAPLKLSFDRLEALWNQVEQLTVDSPFPVLTGREVARKRYRTAVGGSRCFAGTPCSALTSHLFVLPDGQVTICEQLYWNPRFLVGDVRCHSLTEVWQGEQARRLCRLSRVDLSVESPCRTCQLFEDCFGYRNRCWSDVIKAYGADCWDYPDPRCSQVPPFRHPLGYEDDRHPCPA